MLGVHLESASSHKFSTLFFNEAVPAVKKRIYYADCRVWSHIGCAERKPCCVPVTPTLPSDQDDPNTLKNLVAVISSLTSTISDIKKSLNDLVSENKKLRKEIEELKLMNN